MANSLYQNWINLQQGNGTHTLNNLHGNTNIRLALIDEAGAPGAPNVATDIDAADRLLGTSGVTYVESDAAAGSVVAGAGGPAYGSFDHALVTWSSVAGTVSFESIDYYDDTSASNATAPLIVNIDTAGGVGLPVTSNGGDITFDPNAAGVFQQQVT